MSNANDQPRPFGTLLPSGLIERIKLESVRQGIPITRLLANALDAVIPKAHIAADSQPSASPRRTGK